MKKLLLFFFFSCLFFEAVAGPSLSHGNWRWRNDDGSETNATWKGAENQEVKITSSDEMLRLRIKIASQASGFESTFTSQIENQIGYSRSADGPFTRILATNDHAEHFVLASSGHVQGGEATTEQLTPGAGGNFRTGQVIASSTPQGALVFQNESIMKEFEWVLQPTASAQEGKYFFKLSDESIGQPSTLPSVLYTTSPQNKPIAGYLNGLQFDGVNDYVEIPSQPSNQFNSETEFTVSLWFKANSMAVAGLFNRPSGGGDMQFWLTAADGKFTYGIDKHGYGWTWVGTPEAYKVGEWVQVTTVRRNVNGQRKMEIYADGVLVGSGTVNFNSSASNAPIRIGTYMGADGGFANGQIDNVSLWKKALTVEEIKTLGATTLNGKEAGLAGYWRFDETTGTIAYDATSHANHGTLKNMDLATARVASTAGDIKTYENVAYSGKLAGSDPDGKPLSYSLVTAPATGTIVLNSNGNFTYTPAADVVGTDVFSYRVSNGTDVSNTATVIVRIVAVNKAPVPAVAELPTITAECAVTVTAPTAQDDNDGVITGVTTDPVHYATQGSHTITWTYSDSEGLTSTQTQQVIIKDTTKPVFAAVASIAKNNDPDKCGAVVTYPMPAATDNCSSEGKKVLLIWDEINTNTTSLKNALTAAGLDVVLSATSETGYDGTNPLLTGFGAVIHLNGSTYSTAMPAAGQNALVDFVVDKGGTYITNEWSAYEVDASKTMAAMADIVVLERKSATGSSEQVAYSVVAAQAAHPILKNIPATFTLPPGAANSGGVRTYNSNQPIVLMTSPYGAAVAVREFPNGGKAVGFQHTGNYGGSAILSDANAQKLYINAVNFSQSNGTLTITQTAGLPSGVLFPVGKTTNTFTATDAAGNTSTISFDVTISDTQKPTLLTKNITVELDASGKATIAPSQVNNGSIDNCSIPADGYSVDLTNFTCEDVGPNTVTLTVTDGNGNSESATATVTVVDPIKPTIAAPAAVTVNTDAGKNTASNVALGAPTIADNCSGVGVSNNAPTLFPLGNTTVIWTVTDAAGNTATATQVVKVEDKEAPVPAIAMLPAVTGECSATVSAPTATDNVAGPVTGSTTDPTTYTEQGTYTITWTYTDGNGNSSTQTQQVVVDDVTAPGVGTIASKTIAIPAGQSANWNMYRFNFADPLPAGAVVTGITLTYSGRDQGWGGTGASARIIVSDTNIGSNQFLAYSQNFTINFTGDVPGYVYGGNNFMRVDFDTWPGWVANFEGGTLNIHYEVKTHAATLPAITGECSVTVTTIPVANDNCGGAIAGTTTDPLSYTELGTYSIRWSFDDGNGNISTSTQQVVVTDTQKPQVITQNITVELDATGKARITPAMIDDGSTDNCSIPAGGYSLSQTEFTCADLGANTVTLTVTDAKGNSETATATVTVVDPIRPTITAPAAVTVNTDPGKNTASGVVLGTPATADNCSGLALSNNAPAVFPMGNTTVTWTATDAAGNTATATQVITVADKEAPVPTVAMLPIITGQCAATVTAVPSAYDNMSGTVPGKTTDLLSYTEQGTYTITWTYTDAAGNTSSQTQQVIVKDDTAPVVRTRNITVELDANGKASIVASDVNDGSTDNCGVASYKVDIAEFGCSNVGENVVTLTVTDGSGNSSSAVAVVTVVGNVAPVAIAKNITVTLDAAGKATISAADVSNGSTGTCGIKAMSLDKTAFDCSDIGENTVTLTVTDVNNNVSTATAVVTVADNAAPVVLTKNITVQLDANGNATIAAADLNNGSADNCGIASVTVSRTVFDCSHVGVNDVVLTVTDVNGNAATATAQVTVEDKVKPNAVAKNITVYLNASGAASITAADIDGGSQDVCSEVTLALDKATFNCTNIGENTVTLLVTDASGNRSTATATVTVLDNVAPIVRTRPISVQLDAEGKATITAAQINDNSSDNCGIATVALDKTAFDCSQTGANTVTLTVTDKYGNSASAPATVTVLENIAPTVLTRNITVALDADGKATVTADQINNGSSDNCGIAAIALSKTDFGCQNLGENTVTLTVTDKSGNKASATATITVEDTTAPIAMARNLVVQLDASGRASITAAQLNDGSSDNCGIETLSLDKSSFSCEDLGENTVTLTVTDKSGNQSTATATVTIEDKVAPVVIVQHITIQLDASGAATITTADINKGSSDNCGIASMTLSKTSFDCSNVGANEVTLTVTDGSGNTATATATVTVEDLSAPIVLVKDITVQLDAAGSATITAAELDNGSADNCGIVSLSLDKSTFGCEDTGENKVTLTVTDASGNQATAVATVTVEDKVAPMITAPVAVVVNVDAGKTTASNVALGEPAASDNCSVASVTNDAPVEFPTGTTTVTWTVTDASGNSTTATQTVTVRRDIVSVASPAQINVPIRTTYPGVPLPGTVMVTYSDGATEAIGVVWAQGTYNGLIAGIYPLTGQLTLADGTTNLRGLTAQVIVEVEPNIAPTALAFSATTFKPEATADEVIGTLTTTDPDDTEFVYTLASGEGDTHNALFGVRGDQVYLKSNKGLSGMTSFSIRVRSTDPYLNTIERTFTLTKQAYDRTVDQLKIVNAFSPNGDGVNDNWTIPELRFYNEVYIQVFDRSGVRVFETTDPEKGWDGRGTNGRILKGPFLFTVEVRDINWVKRGVVTILGK
ncbi:HYR domain-containing protein [Pontibacter sp. FD36]|uniref:HYR domain-containing protein n=1 Tax=Pontibacter sp. FD36 TaxID=2789860 RepID=UPI0018AB25D5|nr:HYR domain-containing protein [Pontibacter sp. FD36]MBF8964112.1 HYR domain-containing protein [Pontibacter sp. FD36]